VPGCVVRGLRKGRGTACTQQQQVARPLHGGLACAWVVRPGRGRMGSTDGNMERLAGSQAMAIGTRSTMPQPFRLGGGGGGNMVGGRGSSTDTFIGARVPVPSQQPFEAYLQGNQRSIQ
jgi:hypothetical protein